MEREGAGKTGSEKEVPIKVSRSYTKSIPGLEPRPFPLENGANPVQGGSEDQRAKRERGKVGEKEERIGNN